MQALRAPGRRVGLVPTMGNLHEGHLTLVDEAKKHCDYVLATIFVNPLQFGPFEDLENYPRTHDEDFEKLSERHCDGVFVPSVSEIYPNGMKNQTLITVPGLSENHCGKSRPGHFAGVCTVVCKLFNLTMPDIAFFGEKDYQQLQVIRKMTVDLCIPVQIHGVPTVRAASGLALSSRNGYLDESQLETAACLYRGLKTTAEKIGAGDNNFPELELEAENFLTDSGLKVDYFHICHAETLEPAAEEDTHLVILAAAYLGPTRLIDNISISLAG